MAIKYAKNKNGSVTKVDTSTGRVTVVEKDSPNMKYIPNDFGGSAGWSTTQSSGGGSSGGGVDSSGRYKDTGAPAWLGLNPDGSLKDKGPSGGTAAPQQVAVPNTYDIEGYIEDLARAQRQAAIAGLDKSRSQALSNLSQEKSTIQPMYYDKRNQANVAMNNNARSFAEYMASRGLQSSGVAAQGTLNNLNEYQGNIGSLGRQEQAAFDDIARRTTDVENAYQSDLAAANAGIQAQQMQQLIAEMQRQRDLAVQQEQFNKQFGLSEAGVTGTYNGSPTLAALDAARNFGLSEAGVTGVYKGTPTLAAQTAQWQKALQEAGLVGMYNGTPTLAKQAQDWGQGGFGNSYDLWKAQNSTEFNQAKEIQRLQASLRPSSSSGSKPTATEIKNAGMAEDYAYLKALSVKDAKKAMTDNWSELIKAYGTSGAKELWNQVMADAIDMGQAEPK